MSGFVRHRSEPYLGTAYETDAVSDDSHTVRRSLLRNVTDGAVTCGQQQAGLFQQIIEARSIAAVDDWDGEGGRVVNDSTVEAAIELLFALPRDLPMPEITPESTGEIAFEWYKDKHNVAVLTVDGEYIRWAAMVGDSVPPGSEPFTRAIPYAALEAIRAVSNSKNVQ
jgi:hypothetical protein